MADDLTPKELAMVLRAREEERLQAILGPSWEQDRCQRWNIPYDDANPTAHRDRLAMIDRALREMVDAHMRNWKWLGAAGRAVGAGSQSIGKRVWDTLMGALVVIGLGWLATRFGFKLPGVP